MDSAMAHRGDSAQQIEAVCGPVPALPQGTGGSPSPGAGLLEDAFEELRNTLAELQVAEEELRQQNEELAAASQAVEEERRRYQELFEWAPDGYLVTDAMGTILEANRAAAALLGTESRFLVRKPLVTFVLEEERLAFRTELTRLLQVGRGQEWEVRLRPRHGVPVPTALTVAAVREPGGKPDALRWLLRDITERKRAEEERVLLAREQAARAEAEAAQARLSFLAEASSVLAASLDEKTTLASLARLAVPRLADWCVVDMLEEDQSICQVAVAHEDPSKVDLARELRRRYPPIPDAPHSVWQVLLTGRSDLVPEVSDALLVATAHDAEHLRIKRLLGINSFLRVPLLARGRTLGAIWFASAESGRRYGPAELALAEDLARRAALAVDNARLYRESQEANEAKDRFLTVLSHELRTPLTPIQASVELLRRAAHDPERVRRTAEVIERNVCLQASLVDDLLDLSRITRGRLSLERCPVALGELVGETLDGLQAEAETAGLTLAWEPPAAEVYAEVDPFRIQQVLLNLVGNAIKYTLPGGRVSLTLSSVGEKARLVVEDTGIGISPAALPLIFRMFYQEEDGTVHPGLGVGLALVESLVRIQGGRVWAESPGPGNGSRFTVELPALAVALPTPTTGAPTPEPAAPPEGSGSEVLLVEDNQDSRETLVEVLELMGYQVREAASAEEALALLAGWRPDAILSDIGLPGADGYELMRRVRQMPRQVQVVGLAVTGYGTSEDRGQALAAGFDGHVTKPLNMAALDRQLRELLAASRRAALSNPALAGPAPRAE